MGQCSFVSFLKSVLRNVLVKCESICPVVWLPFSYLAIDTAIDTAGHLNEVVTTVRAAFTYW